MIDTLKAIGIPVTAAAVISALVVTIPLLFQIDERYAKEEDLRVEVAALKIVNQDLQRELAQLAGFQQAMTQFISEGRIPAPRLVVGAGAPLRRVELTPQPSPVEAPDAAPPPVIEQPEAASAPTVLEAPRNWRELNEGLVRQQKRLDPQK